MCGEREQKGGEVRILYAEGPDATGRTSERNEHVNGRGEGSSTRRQLQRLDRVRFAHGERVNFRNGRA